MGKKCVFYHNSGVNVEAGCFRCSSPNCSEKCLIEGTATLVRWSYHIRNYCQNNAVCKGNGKKGFFGTTDSYCQHHPNPEGNS